MKRRSFLQALAAFAGWPKRKVGGELVVPLNAYSPDVIYAPTPSIGGLPVTLVRRSDVSLGYNRERDTYSLEVYIPNRLERRRARYDGRVTHESVSAAGKTMAPPSVYFHITDAADYALAKLHLPEILQIYGIPGPRALAVRLITT